ncbi:zinc-binding alcohol dehydrogenase family protein [Kitasatospora sp. NPDC088346]|uniref:quinone oxidoreductase family protein n=1 Tax=Kitasatospora sp. NPDC088346 TaxID=3364073 RepID=UPI0037F32B1B
MRKVSLHTYQGPAGLRLGEAPEPVAGPGELVVRTEAAGVTLPVLKVLRGHGEVPLPHTPGGDLVGRVTAVGAGVEGYRVGDRVGGVAFEGLYADLVAVPAALVAPVPEQVPAPEALATVRGGVVALAALRAGHLAPGESVLVTAAAGGVGHLAVQVAKALGAGRVVAAAGSPDKADFLRELGADEVVGYDALDRAGPVDLAVDGVGGEVAQRAVGALVPFGRLVVNSGAGGTLDAGALLRGMHTAVGLSMAQLARLRPELIERYRAELWEMLDAGRLRPRCVVLPLARTDRAVALLEDRANRGKVVLVP